jgi:ankyrin repeat protein
MKTRSLLFVLVLAATAGCTHHEPGQLTPLMSAASAGNAARVKELIAAGTDVNAQRGLRLASGMRIEGDTRSNNETALMFAIDGGDLESIRALLDAGARVDVQEGGGNAVWRRLDRRLNAPNAVEILRLLLSRSPRIPSDSATSMLHTAMSGANETVVSIVLDHVDDPMIAYCFTELPLDDAHFPSMMALLEKRIGAPKGRALECGVQADTPLKLQYFLEHGADPSHLGSPFRPLSRIVFDVVHGYGLTDDRREMIKLLLRYGADPALSDKTENGSPIDMARKAGNTALLDLLTPGSRVGSSRSWTDHKRPTPHREK